MKKYFKVTLSCNPLITVWIFKIEGKVLVLFIYTLTINLSYRMYWKHVGNSVFQQYFFS